jgi:alpha-mannosidase
MGGPTVFDADPIFLPNAKNVIVETVKPADIQENALVIRAYEAMGKQTECAFSVHPKVKTVEEADMLEENGHAVDANCVHFGPFEIKTFILQL